MNQRCDDCGRLKPCCGLPVEIAPDGATQLLQICEACNLKRRISANESILEKVVNLLNAHCDSNFTLLTCGMASHCQWLEDTGEKLRNGYTIAQSAIERIEDLHDKLIDNIAKGIEEKKINK